MHRVLGALLLLAAKLSTDRYFTNPHFAKIAGVTVEEMNRLERVCDTGFWIVWFFVWFFFPCGVKMAR